MHRNDIEKSNEMPQMSEFESISIFEALTRINSETRPLYLPAIQRHFVWKKDQICNLFDSMMRGYPIGTFLFWEIEDKKRNDYAFYEFIREHSEHSDECCNPTAPTNLPKGLTGVLDGQQRLNSIYVAICGSYSAFVGGKGNHKSKKESFPKSNFHLNVLFEPIIEEEVIYEFRFLLEREVLSQHFDDKHFWVPIGLIYHCESKKQVKEELLKFAKNSARISFLKSPQIAKAVSKLDLLRHRIHDEKLITYFPIRKCSSTEALQIFIRANNGGTNISNANMIFSTIIAHWTEGRRKIESLAENINEIGNQFQFETSHIMLGCLALSGCPIKLKIESFKPVHVKTISHKWDSIYRNLRKAAEIVDDWGLSGNNAVNLHAIIALAIFIRVEINIDRSKKQLRQFVIKSLICELYRRPERALQLIREFADVNLCLGGDFNMKDFESKFKLPSGKKMEVSSELLEDLLMLPISDPRTYVLLSLLHTQHALHQHAFQKDHIHPNSGFGSLTSFNLSQEQIQEWIDWKDRLPNIQLLQDGENNNKRAKPFHKWLSTYRPNRDEQRAYLAENDIPAGVSLEFEDFEVFFSQRKERLRKRLVSLLNVTVPSSLVSDLRGGAHAVE